MQLINAYQLLKKTNRQVFHTGDVASILNITPGAASQISIRLRNQGFVVSLKKGLWCISEGIDPLFIAEELVAPFPSYLSCQTALYYHNMIDQIPSVIYSVTPGRTKTFKTTIGSYSFHHLDPSFFFGYDTIGKQQIKMASPEKALLDFFYLQPGKSPLFRALPELEIPPQFSWEKTWDMLDKIKHPRIKTLIKIALQPFLQFLCVNIFLGIFFSNHL